MKIVVAGGANLDLLGRAKGRALPGDSTPGTVRFRCGGVGRNICENLARLGAETALLSAVGDDWASELILRSCADAGIDVSGLLHVSGRTGAYLAAEDGDGELLAAINDMEILQALTPAALTVCTPLLHAADALVLDANLPEQSLVWLAEQFSGPIFADPVSCAKAERLLPLLPRLAFLKPNRAELYLLSGRDGVKEGMEALQARGVQSLCVSLGAEGAALLTAGGDFCLVPAPHVPICSVTGAGDSLTSGTIFGLLSGKAPERALRFGTAAAALTLQYDGAVRPDLSVSLVNEAEKEWLS
ncbi:MAG: carbohydrate kinase family protein [Clostridiaceae bacterium]|nr:carbohydrate kinase family protein [Clostridiaceae bacterium]